MRIGKVCLLEMKFNHAVRHMTGDNRRVTYSEINLTFGIGMTAIWTILHTHLIVGLATTFPKKNIIPYSET